MPAWRSEQDAEALDRRRELIARGDAEPAPWARTSTNKAEADVPLFEEEGFVIENMAQDERKPIPTRAELIANLQKAAAARKQQYKEEQPPPPPRPDPSQDVPGPDVGNRGW